MTRFFINIFFLMPFFCFSQEDTSQIPIPMKNRIVFYESVYNAGHAIKKNEVYGKLVKWFSDTSNDLKKKINSYDRTKTLISGAAIFRIVTNDNGNYYWMRTTLNITIYDSGYAFQSYNYYEKPIVKGITNDWSKIEYRWRDFSKGKPWSTDDRRLFLGLNSETGLLIKSLEQSMSK